MRARERDRKRAGRPLHPDTVAAIDILLANPNYDVREDGTVWKKVGGGDKINGRDHPTVAVKVPNKKRYASVPIHYLIYKKFYGALPKDNEYVIFKDGNPLNKAADNLKLSESPYGRKMRRSSNTVSFDEELAIKQDYANGKSIYQISVDYKVTGKLAKRIIGIEEK